MPTPALHRQDHELKGWRSWMVVPAASGPHPSAPLALPPVRLLGARWQVWESAVMEAECRPLLLSGRASFSAAPGFAPVVTRDHTPPGDGCTCGVYAAKSKSAALTQFPAAVVAYGEVALFGDVAEHEGGFRAAAAKILSPLFLSVAGRCLLCPRLAPAHPPTSMLWFRSFPTRFIGGCEIGAAAALAASRAVSPPASSGGSGVEVFPMSEWMKGVCLLLGEHYGVEVEAPQLVSAFPPPVPDTVAELFSSSAGGDIRTLPPGRPGGPQVR